MKNSDDKFSADRRQQLIISAAKSCFSRSGFHGANMADISRGSGLGAGQIYRYFSSKEEIITETIKSIAVNWRVFLQTHLPHQTSAREIINTESGFWKKWTFQDRVLLLEMYSEASRNTLVCEIVVQEEKLLFMKLDELYKNKMPGENATQRSNRIHFLLMLVDGVACRAFGNQNMDQQELTRIDGIFSRHLFLCEDRHRAD